MRLRRVIRVVLPLAAVGFAFLVARHFYLGWIADLRSPGGPLDGRTPGLKEGAEEIHAKPFRHIVSENVDVTRRDKAGRTVMRFFADRIEHVSKTGSVVTRPRIQHFSKGGETIALAGDEAEIVRTRPEGLSLDDIQSGTIRGNVVLSHDRGTPDDSLDDVFVTLDELTFDNQAYEMATDGPVVLVSSDMDLTARRMRIAIDRETGRVSAMTFAEDIMATFARGDRLRMDLLKAPNGLPREAPAAGTGEPAAPEEASPGEVPASGRPAGPAASPPPPAPAGPTPAAAGKDDARETWRIDLAGDVDARQLDQRLLCDRLRLYSETAAPSPRPAPAKAADGELGTRNSELGTQALRSAQGDSDRSREAQGALAQAPAPQAQGLGPPAPDAPPLIVIADGPLTITPMDAAERQALGDAVHEVSAVGRPAVVLDGRLRAEGAEIVYNTRSGRGRMDGKDEPILIEEPDRLRVAGGRLEFERDPAAARLVGRGDLKARVATQGLTGVRPRAGEAEAPAALEAAWEDQMRLAFYPLAADAPAGSVPEIRRAEFHGQAAVKQEDGTLRGDHLVIHFFPSEVRRYAIVMPKFGDGASAARILDWKVKAGDKIDKGAVLAVVQAEPPADAPPTAGLLPAPAPPAAPPGLGAPGPAAGLPPAPAPPTAAAPPPAGAPAPPAAPKPLKAELRSSRDGRILTLERAVGDVVPFGRVILHLEARSTQAVERLVGQGDVFIQRQGPADAEANKTPGVVSAGPPSGPSGKRHRVPFSPPAAPGPGPAEGLGQIGDIRCQDLDLGFARSPDGGSQPKELKAAGEVAIHDPKGRLRAEDLTVRFARDAGGRLDASFLEARGAVLIEREDLYAEGEYVKRDLAASRLVLEGKPAVARERDRRIAGESIEFLPAERKARARGRGQIEMPASTDLRGQEVREPRTLRIQWTQGMYLEDARNFASFDGGVVATVGPALLECERLWVCFKDRPDSAGAAPGPAGAAPGPPGNAASAARNAERGTRNVERAAAAASDADPIRAKAIERVLAEGTVHAVEQPLDDDGAVRLRMEMTGQDLTYLQEDRKAYMRKPGRLAILARDPPEGGRRGPGLSPEEAAAAREGVPPPGYSWTTVSWADRMAYDDSAGQAYFKGNVDAAYAGRSVPLAVPAGARREASRVRIASETLQIAFDRQEVPTGRPQAVTAGPADPLGQRMDLKALVADEGVRMWFDERRGSGHRLVYQGPPEEIVRVLSGPAGLARFWQENEAKQEFGALVAQTITYYPATGRVETIGQRLLSGAAGP